MQIRGRTLVALVFGLGMAMAGASWWYHYRQTDQTAQFWGRPAATLLLGSPTLQLLRLSRVEPPEALGESTPPGPPEEQLAAWRIVDRRDFSDAPGLVHFRHALTYDDNFDWPARKTQQESFEAAYGLRFADDERELVLLFPRDFSQMGRLEGDRQTITLLPCKRMASALTQYLGDIGVLGEAHAD